MTNEVKDIGSISVKELGWNAKAIRKAVDGKGKEKVWLGRIGGLALQLFTGISKNGEWTGFKGRFAGVNPEGMKVTSGVAFFPANVTKELVKQFEAGVVEVEVKADIYAVETDKNASGYAFMCEPVVTGEHHDRAAKIANSMFEDAGLLKLQAPKKVEPQKVAKAG